MCIRDSQQPQHHLDRRGGRDPAAARDPADRGLHRDAGIFLQQGAPRRRDRADVPDAAKDGLSDPSTSS